MPKQKPAPSPHALSETLLAAIRQSGSAGITAQQLALKVGIKEKGKLYMLYEAVDELLGAGKVKSGKKGRYHAGGEVEGGHARGGGGSRDKKPRDQEKSRPATISGGGNDRRGGRSSDTETVEGTLDIVSNGSGYLRRDGVDDDLFVHMGNLGLALSGDTVLAKVVQHRGRKPEAKVLEVLKRKRSDFVGTVHKDKGRFYVRPDDQKMNRVFTLRESDRNGANEGEKVVLILGDWRDQREHPPGIVQRILGKAGENETEIHAILAEFGLPYDFPDHVEAEAASIKNGCTPQEISKRRDVRNITTLTIDPEDAKDLDDALSLRKLESGNWEVGVHIADVSHYVRPGMAIEEEGSSRATSVYLVDRVVPMLPEKLSNGLCSLHPGEDKLSFSAIFELDEKAQIINEWFGRTVMHSNRRFAYADAQAIINGGDGEYKNEVLTLHRLAQVLRKDRMANGALEVGGNEVKFKLDEKGRPLGVYEKVMAEANWLIEEFMLLANKRVATYVGSLKKGGAHPFVYRVHDLPDEEKIDQLKNLAKSFGHSLVVHKGEELAHAINRLLADVKGTDEENIVKQVTIRSMAKAIYSTDNIGHYGLAFDHYTHFTSPIRRYPDLLVHRALAHYLAGGSPLNKGTLETSCKHSSMQERRAADAERASIRYKQSEFLLQRIGQSFDGLITGITSWGIYVELKENKCEGMISIRDLRGDTFKFLEGKFQVVGMRTGKTYRLGDELRVTIRAVDMEKRVVDLVPEGSGAQAPQPERYRKETRAGGKRGRR